MMHQDVFKKWFNQPLEIVAIDVISYSLNYLEHDFLDFKQDFHLERKFQRNKDQSENYTKEGISYMLERYCVAFSNSHGGFLVVGVAEHKKGFFIKGINFKNMKRRTMISYIKSEQKRIKKHLHIDFEFLSLIIGNKELLIFKILEGKNKPYYSSNGKYFYREEDNTLSK
jgi:predicted HTH transcriptional regulator